MMHPLLVFAAPGAWAAYLFWARSHYRRVR